MAQQQQNKPNILFIMGIADNTIVVYTTDNGVEPPSGQVKHRPSAT